MKPWGQRCKHVRNANQEQWSLTLALLKLYIKLCFAASFCNNPNKLMRIFQLNNLYIPVRRCIPNDIFAASPRLTFFIGTLLVQTHRLIVVPGENHRYQRCICIGCNTGYIISQAERRTGNLGGGADSIWPGAATRTHAQHTPVRRGATAGESSSADTFMEGEQGQLHVQSGWP